MLSSGWRTRVKRQSVWGKEEVDMPSGDGEVERNGNQETHERGLFLPLWALGPL